MRTSPWGWPEAISSSTAVRIRAMPDLSSAPSRVVPSVTIRCLPLLRVREGNSLSRMTMFFS